MTVLKSFILKYEYSPIVNLLESFVTATRFSGEFLIVEICPVTNNRMGNQGEATIRVYTVQQVSRVELHYFELSRPYAPSWHQGTGESEGDFELSGETKNR